MMGLSCKCLLNRFTQGLFIILVLEEFGSEALDIDPLLLFWIGHLQLETGSSRALCLGDAFSETRQTISFRGCPFLHGCSCPGLQNRIVPEKCLTLSKQTVGLLNATVINHPWSVMMRLGYMSLPVVSPQSGNAQSNSDFPYKYAQPCVVQARVSALTMDKPRQNEVWQGSEEVSVSFCHNRI